MVRPYAAKARACGLLVLLPWHFRQISYSNDTDVSTAPAILIPEVPVAAAWTAGGVTTPAAALVRAACGLWQSWHSEWRLLLIGNVSAASCAPLRVVMGCLYCALVSEVKTSGTAGLIDAGEL